MRMNHQTHFTPKEAAEIRELLNKKSFSAGR
jgi:hypothetical protein